MTIKRGQAENNCQITCKIKKKLKIFKATLTFLDFLVFVFELPKIYEINLSERIILSFHFVLILKTL